MTVHLLKFQSRNRESYLFKMPISSRMSSTMFLFQSRNRESYLFKCRSFARSLRPAQSCFNLAIENLIFSSLTCEMLVADPEAFQSRNRESYLFKSGSTL